MGASQQDLLLAEAGIANMLDCPSESLPQHP
jgi:hypothetical protein